MVYSTPLFLLLSSESASHITQFDFDITTYMLMEIIKQFGHLLLFSA